MKVREVMRQGAAWVEAGKPFMEVAGKMIRQGLRFLPVKSGRKFVGVITYNTLLSMLQSRTDITALTASDVMSRDFVYCGPCDDVNDAARTLRSRQFQRMPVLDSRLNMLGVISLAAIEKRANKPEMRSSRDHRSTPHLFRGSMSHA